MAAKTKARYWWRKLRRQRIELWISDGETHVHVKARAKTAYRIVEAIKPMLATVPEFPDERERLYHEDVPELGDDAAAAPGQLRMSTVKS